MEEIIDYLNTPLTIDELSSISGIKVEELEDKLKDLKKNGYIVKENGKYANIKYYNMVRGIIQVKEKGYGFLKADNEVEYYVDKDNINDSMNGDLVLARVYKGYDGNLDEAVIIRIIKRNTILVVGYESVLQHEKTSKQEIKERAMDLFEKMKLSDGERILKSYPFELSGGMNQRVGIMMAMILRPSLLFGDEPTSALDVTVQAQVVREMMKMRELFGTAIAIVTHNIGVVEYMADKVAVMYQGRLVEYGDTKQVIQHPEEEYTRKLINAVLRIHRG